MARLMWVSTVDYNLDDVGVFDTKTGILYQFNPQGGTGNSAMEMLEYIESEYPADFTWGELLAST